jgi:hypothetical protein
MLTCECTVRYISKKIPKSKNTVSLFKESLTRDFRPLFFSSNNSPLAPDTRVKTFLEYGFEFAEKIDYEIVDFHSSGVNDTAVTKNDL